MRRGFRRPWFLYHPEDLVQQVLSVVVQSLSHVWLFVTPWTAARQASLSFTISQSLLRLTSIESVMSSNHLFQGPAQTPWTISVPGSAKCFLLQTPGAHWVVAFCVLIFQGAGKVLGGRHNRQGLEGKYPSSFPPPVDHPRGPQQDWAPATHSSHSFMNTPFLSFPLFPSELSGIISQINCSHPSLCFEVCFWGSQPETSALASIAQKSVVSGAMANTVVLGSDCPQKNTQCPRSFCSANSFSSQKCPGMGPAFFLVDPTFFPTITFATSTLVPSSPPCMAVQHLPPFHCSLSSLEGCLLSEITVIFRLSKRWTFVSVS